MLIRSIMLGDMLPAALDSCATNCFLSEKLSQKLTSKGYPPVRSAVRYDVEQGRPLCSTNMVHFLPVSMVSEEGKLVEWEFCFFIIANCGADVIIGFPTLSQGKIIKYEPPVNYVRMLQGAVQTQTKASKQILQEQARSAAANAQDHTYGPPKRIVECLRTTIAPVSEPTPAGEAQAELTPPVTPGRSAVLVLSTDASAIGWAGTLTSVDAMGARTVIDSFCNLHESFHVLENEGNESTRDANYASGVDFSQDPDELTRVRHVSFRRVPLGISSTPAQIQSEVRRQLAELVEEGTIQPNFSSSNVPRRPRSRSPIPSESLAAQFLRDRQLVQTLNLSSKELVEQGCKPPPKYTYKEEPKLYAPHNSVRQPPGADASDIAVPPKDKGKSAARSKYCIDADTLHSDAGESRSHSTVT